MLKIGIDVSDKITSELVLGNLSEWHRVVKFYTLRLMFAPLIETVILLDRFLYLQENGGYFKLSINRICHGSVCRWK